MRIILCFLVVVLSVSCAKDTSDITLSCFEIDLREDGEYDFLNKWIFLGYHQQDSNISECKPEDIREMSVEFGQYNGFQAISSCNFIEGSYFSSSNDLLSIDNLITTLVACSSQHMTAWEEQFIKALLAVTQIERFAQSIKT